MSHRAETSTENARKPLISVADVPLDSLPTVTIPDEELHAVEIAGAQRAKSHPGSISSHELGARGEYAVATYLGISERFDTNIYDRGDGGIDLRLSGDTVEVKTAGMRQNNPNLLVPTYQKLNSDYYVLAHELSRRVYRILGYTDRTTVRNARIFQGFNYPEAYIVTRDYLEPLPPPKSPSFGRN